MKGILTFVFSLMFACLYSQVSINPIFETEPLDQKAANRFRQFKTYNNWGIKALGLDTLGMQRYAGRNVNICICDTGVPDHQSLKSSIAGYAVFTGEASELDVNGHATHVGGIINEIAPMSKIYYAKVLGDNGSGSFVSVAKGIDWCVEQGAHIINMSLGGRTPSAAMKTAIDNALKTSIVVAAVGNDGTGDVDNIGYPAKWDNVLAVGSIDQTFSVSYFSSSGLEGDVVAPGSSILSTWTDQSYRVLSGTSMATPYVSGLIALYLEAYPEHNTELTIGELLESHAIDVEPQGFDRYTFEGIVSNDIFKRSIDTIHQDPVVDPVTPPSVVKDWRVWVLLILVVSGLIVNYIKNRQ